ncbi:MAG TPA: UDP-forming cellulose synthase catalytic subunit [Nevskiaceae bacterium]|nr:UDP-forming cellulose synthase catalytic subunit [Nevskiaceae bacterium]
MNPLAQRLARTLGVKHAGRLREWLLRIFVLPPEQARPWPRAVVLLVAPLAQLLARALGVRRLDDPREWLLRIFVLPQRLPPPPVRVFEPLLRLLWRAMRRALHIALWPWRWLVRRVSQIDFIAAEERFEDAGDALAGSHRLVRVLLLAASALLFYVTATMPLTHAEQCLFLALMWAVAVVMKQMPGSLPTLALVMLSLLTSARYIWWRVSQTLLLEDPLDYLFGIGLVSAEAYTWLVMILGYFQNAWPLKRKPVPLPADTSSWPTVDVFIPTYNEPLKVVKPTVFAAQGLDWPRDKLNIHILDDGRRAEFREFAREAGVNYVIRNNNAHAKAGNINAALKNTHGEFIAIFDCDHVAVRSFLQTTMGWMLRDPNCAMIQTPHHFFSPDPFEKNLGTFRQVPNEGTLFYGLVQDGNDLWNSTFFCGSCAVIRRAPLEQIGGIAVETVTEDAHTALRLQRLGWNTAYLNLTQAAGLATESLSSHIGQRIRWARGMAQIFRIDNPLFGRGLKLFQRLCYTNAMLHFFHGIPRIVFLTAPLSYLYFQLHVINATAFAIGIYALPHIIMSQVANSRMQGRYRHSFWAEVYESVLAWYIMLPTTLAFFNPKLGKFNVTAKGGLVEQSYFDWTISRPYIALIIANLGGVAIGIGRLLWWNTFEISTVVMNLLWALYNLVMLGTTVGIAEESRQVRQAHRVPMRIPATVVFADGRSVVCRTDDYSTNGLGLQWPAGEPLPAPRTQLQVVLSRGDEEHFFTAMVTGAHGLRLGLRFDGLTLEDERNLVQCTFGRADAWVDWRDPQTQDRPLDSLGEVLLFGLNGYLRLIKRGLAAWSQWRQQAREARTAPREIV